MKYAFRFGYFGDSYFGVTRQPGLPTVESALRDALKKYLRGKGIIFASRTDRGVHALSNVFSADLKELPPLGEINARLEDVWVWGWRRTDTNPQRAADWRLYRYFFPERFGKKDLNEMKKACEAFLGKHDFVSFSIPEVENTVREVLDARVYNSGLTVLEVKARSFLRQMVRRMAFAVYMVGKGEWGIEEIKKRLEKRNPVPPMPPEGLILVHVSTPGIKFRIDMEAFERMKEAWERRRAKARVESASLSSVICFNPFADI